VLLSDGTASAFIPTVMARTLLDSIRACVRRHAMLAPGDTVLAAVSGGADSVALLVALLELRATFRITVVAAHLDHGLRGAVSAADRAFVEDLARGYDVTCFSEVGQVPPGNVEAEARRLRYAFFERVADRLGASKIATAHTRDDQAETVLLRLLRGAGRRGLGGIRPRRGRIIRPMLRCERMQVRAFLVERGLAWRRDLSNFDTALERARMRHGFLPALAREFNPNLAAALADLADLMREEDATLDRLAAAGARSAVLAIPVLHAIEPPLARRALRLWWRHFGSGRRLGRTHVEAILRLATRASDGGEIAVPGGAVVRDGDHMRFDRDRRPDEEVVSWQLPLIPGHDVDTPGGWCLRLETTARDEAPDPDDSICVADADHVGQTLVVRNRRSGDRLRALGLAGHTSLKRLFSARRIPRSRRGDHPIVTCDGEPLWVPGCGRSDRALVGPATTRCHVIRVIRRPNESA
jgi:tRNA(Ile)-lysidine synthase